MPPPPPTVEQLTRALSAVGHLIAGIRDNQWSAPTPCTDWTVHDLVKHLVGVNLAFVALLSDQAPPDRGTDHLGDDPAGAYRDSGVAVQAAFEQPGVLERTYHGPLGAASGAEQLPIRIVDLLAHGWDLAQATGQPAELPEGLADQALAFARIQLSTRSYHIARRAGPTTNVRCCGRHGRGDGSDGEPQLQDPQAEAQRIRRIREPAGRFSRVIRSSRSVGLMIQIAADAVSGAPRANVAGAAR
jgi:uncharacterized protein (TIGR03086 family)